MISGMKTIILLLFGAFVLVSSGAALAALTTEELTKLKTSGLGEDVIRYMIENDYGNVDRVVRLKDAGFADETISSVIRNDLKASGEGMLPTLQPEKAKQVQPTAKLVVEEPATIQTSADVKIEQYLVRGEQVIQNSQDIQNATVSLLQGRRLRVEWDSSKVAPSVFQRKPFSSPFYWDLHKGDGLHSVNPKDNSFILRTGHSHQGRPKVDKAHYWIMYLTPNSPDLAKRIRELLSE